MLMALPLRLSLAPKLQKQQCRNLFSPFSSISTTATQSNKLIVLRRKVSPFAALSSASAAPTTEEPTTALKKRLIAQNIPWSCTADDIRVLFEKYGTVVDVELSMYNSSRNRGLAFVSMSSEEEATSALNGLNSYELDGRVITVEFARSLKKSTAPQLPASPGPKYNVFVGNLSWRVRSRDLREFFNGCGEILSAEIIFQSNPRRSAGYGFVSFASKEEAEAAVAALNDKELMGRPARLALGRVPEVTTETESIIGEQLEEASTGVSI